MKRIVRLLILAGFGISGVASAACLQLTPAQIAEVQSHGYLGYQNLQLNVIFPEGSVSIDPDLAVGSLIATGYTAPISIQSAIVACTNTGSMKADYDTPPQPSPLPNYYKTNVKGIGFRLSYVRANGNESPLPFGIDVPIPTPPDPPDGVVYGYLGAGARFRIELVKTEDIADRISSVVLTNPVGTGRDDRSVTVTTVTSSGIVVTIQPSCSVKSNVRNIDFGTFGPADVSATSGPTQSVKFTVHCSGPTPPASITAMLKGTPDSDDSSLLQNAGGAANLAIQLKDISTNTVLHPNNPASTITQTPIDMQSPFALEATVLRVGNVPPTAGKIQATATIVMTLL